MNPVVSVAVNGFVAGVVWMWGFTVLVAKAHREREATHKRFPCTYWHRGDAAPLYIRAETEQEAAERLMAIRETLSPDFSHGGQRRG